jgi:uncharacterized protein involved in exopolysaccharide biosynthesis
MSDEKKPGEEKASSEKSQVEVRYVPIEYMPHMNEEDDEIDLMVLAKRIWDGRWTIVKITAVFIGIGLFVALFSAEEFQSEAVLMPEIQQQDTGGASQLLQRFGGQFGISAGGNSSPGMIPPMIYPRIVNSLSFQLELLDEEIQFREYGVTTTWPDFLENHYSRPLTATVYDYTIGLPFTVLGGVRSLFSEEEEVVVVSEDQLSEEYIEITQTQLDFIENLRGRINVSLDPETGLLNASVKLQDARAAAELNRLMIDLLKEYVTEYRVEKARSNVEFTERQKEEAQERFEEAQLALAEFQDRNVSLSTARAQTELEQLQDEKDLAFNVYNSLSQRYEEARLELQEQTPVFSEVQSVNVPTKRSEPKRGQTVVIFTVLGVIISVGFVLMMPFFNTMASKFNS